MPLCIVLGILSHLKEIFANDDSFWNVDHIWLFAVEALNEIMVEDRRERKKHWVPAKNIVCSNNISLGNSEIETSIICLLCVWTLFFNVDVLSGMNNSVLNTVQWYSLIEWFFYHKIFISLVGLVVVWQTVIDQTQLVASRGNVFFSV